MKDTPHIDGVLQPLIMTNNYLSVRNQIPTFHAGDVVSGDTSWIEAALVDYPLFYSCDIEGRRGGTSYSVETLQQLSETYPQHEYFFIMGLDSFQEIGLWKDYARLFEFAHIVVAARPGFEGSLQEFLPVAIADRFCYDSDSKNLRFDTGFSLFAVAHTCRDISSTEIRQQLSMKRDIGEQVPLPVIEYIRAHQLYT